MEGTMDGFVRQRLEPRLKCKTKRSGKMSEYEPNGEFAREPVERVAPYLNKYDAVISNSMVELAPKSLSVAFMSAISSFIPAFLLTPA
jgi:hypothetical protein